MATVTQKRNNEHIMLSYHWDNQELVSKIYFYLKEAQPVAVWMDRYGGMGDCLSVSMAEGVENCCAFVCFLTPGYQESANCKKELTYAVQLRKPIIPCLFGSGSKDGKWKPSKWLGLTITDLLYLNFTHINDSNFEDKCQELINRVQLIVGAPELQEQKSFSSSNVNVEEVNNEDFEISTPLIIPAAIREGPHIVEKTVSIVPKKYKSEGDSAIRLINQSSEIECNQDTFASHGYFFNWFIIPRLLFHNTSSEFLAILQVSAEYQDTSNDDDKWTPCQVVASPDEEMINIDPKKLVMRSVTIKIKLHGSPGVDNEHRFRAHNLLPQPLRLKLIIEDSQMQHASLIVEQVNRPLNLATPDKLEAKWQISHSNVLGFVWADDCSIDVRYFVLIYYLSNDDQLLKFLFGCDLSGRQSPQWDKKMIQTLQRTARRENQTELDVHQGVFDSFVHCKALFDDQFKLQAIRVQIKTNTSSTEETVALPIKSIFTNA